MYKAYVFDFDYTLANSEKGIVMCFQLLFEAEGYDGIPEEAIRRTIGMTMYDAMALLTGETDPDRVNALIWEYKVRFSDKYMTANTHLYPQTLPTLRALKDAGALCCIASTKTRSRIGETLRKASSTSSSAWKTSPRPNRHRTGSTPSAATSAWIKRTSSTSVTIPSTPEPQKMPASPLPP